MPFKVTTGRRVIDRSVQTSPERTRIDHKGTMCQLIGGPSNDKETQIEDRPPKEDYSGQPSTIQPQKKRSLSPKEKKLQAAAAGTRNIRDFFKPKKNWLPPLCSVSTGIPIDFFSGCERLIKILFRMEVMTAVRYGSFELRILVASVELLPNELTIIDHNLLGYMNRHVTALNR